MTLTPSQKDAVTDTSGDSLIVAGAGSGKTRVLVEKVAWVVEQQHLSPDRIVVITFTEKAAGELRERLGSRLQNRLVSDIGFIGTIHAFAASLIRQNAAALGINPEFEVMDEPLARLERDRIVRDGFLRLVEAGDPSALQVLDQFGFYRGLKVLKDLFPFAPLLGQLNEAYAASKREKNFLDFRDLEEFACRLACQGDYSWLFVDEFQDTSPRQWELISLLHNPEKNRLVLVGDPRQSIYRFRGADPHLFEKAVAKIGKWGGRIHELNENFRSRPEIITFVNKIICRLFPSSPPLIATRPPQDKGVLRLEIPATSTLEERRTHEAEVVRKKISELQGQKVEWGEMALLFRTRRAVPIFEEELRKGGIPYHTKVGSSLLERPEVVSLILWMRFLADPEDKIARTGLDYSPLKGIDPVPQESDLTDVVELLFQKSLPFFPDQAMQANLLEFKKLLFRLIRLGVQSFQEIVLMIERLRREESGIPVPPDGSSREAVQLLTIHAAKGLEFPVVFLCDLAGRVSGTRTFLEDEKGIVLREKEEAPTGLKERLVKPERFIRGEAKEKEEDLEESKRLLYVALTRASELLVLPVEREVKKSSKGNRWIDWIVDSRTP